MKCYIKNKTKEQQWKQYYPMLRSIAKQCAEYHDLAKRTLVSVILVNEEEIHQINKQYRGVDKPTDVITFAAMEGDVFQFDEIQELGDIFINTNAIAEQAKEYGHSEQREFGFLFVHGLLHTLGYDHMNKEDESKMIAVQKAILDPIISR